MRAMAMSSAENTPHARLGQPYGPRTAWRSGCLPGAAGEYDPYLRALAARSFREPSDAEDVFRTCC